MYLHCTKYQQALYDAIKQGWTAVGFIFHPLCFNKHAFIKFIGFFFRSYYSPRNVALIPHLTDNTMCTEFLKFNTPLR